MSQVTIPASTSFETMSDNYRGRGGHRGDRLLQGHSSGWEYVQQDPSYVMYGPHPATAEPYAGATFYNSQGHYFDPYTAPNVEHPAHAARPHRGRGQGQLRGPRSHRNFRQRPPMFDHGRTGDYHNGQVRSYYAEDAYTGPQQQQTDGSSTRAKPRQRSYHQGRPSARHKAQQQWDSTPSYDTTRDPNSSYQDRHWQQDEHSSGRGSKKQDYGYQRQVRSKVNDKAVAVVDSKVLEATVAGKDNGAVQSSDNSGGEGGVRGKGRSRASGRGGRGSQRGNRGNALRRGSKKDTVENDETQRGKILLLTSL